MEQEVENTTLISHFACIVLSLPGHARAAGMTRAAASVVCERGVYVLGEVVVADIEEKLLAFVIVIVIEVNKEKLLLTLRRSLLALSLLLSLRKVHMGDRRRKMERKMESGTLSDLHLCRNHL